MHDLYVDKQTARPLPAAMRAAQAFQRNAGALYVSPEFLEIVRFHLIHFQSYAKITAAERRLAARIYQDSEDGEAFRAAIKILGHRRAVALARWKARDPAGVALFESFTKVGRAA